MMRRLMVVVLLVVCCLFSSVTWAVEPPVKGDTVPALEILAPDLAKDKAYLGLAEGAVSVTLADVPGKVMLVEVVGVYCPFCHEQVPAFNKLFKRLKRGKLDNEVKMVALASGATQPEVEHLRKHSNYAYPVLRDENWSVHEKLGKPKTPYTLVLNKQGEVLFTHTGVVKDIDGLFLKLKEYVQ